jgi:hypothetical protein
VLLLLQGYRQGCSTSRRWFPATATAAQFAHLVGGAAWQLTLQQLSRQESLLQQLWLQRQLLVVLLQQLLRMLVQQQQEVLGLTVMRMMAMRATLRMMQLPNRLAVRVTVKMKWRSGSSASSSSSNKRQQHYRLQLEEQQQQAGSPACATGSSGGLLHSNSNVLQQPQLMLLALVSQLVCLCSSRCQQGWGRLLQCSSCCLLRACQAGRAWGY